MIPLDEVVHFDVITSGSTGAATDADSGPIFDVFEEATDTPILDDQSFTKRTSLTGNYRGTFTASAANGFEAGKWYSVIASATVGGVAGKTVALGFRVAPVENSAGVPKVALANVAHGGAAATFTLLRADLSNTGSGPALTLTAADTSALEVTATTGHAINVQSSGGNGNALRLVPHGTGFGLNGTISGNITGNLSGSVGSVTGAVGSVTGNVGGNVAGSVGSVTGAVGSVTGSVGSVVGAVGSVTGNIGGNVAGSVASVTNPVTITGDAATFATRGLTMIELDGAVYRFTTNSLEQAPSGGSPPSAATIADAVWDEALAGHAGAGSAGAALTGAGAAADPLATAVPGAYAGGTAGYILGNLAATNQISLVSPVSADLSISITRGDSYMHVDGRALLLSNAAFPVLTGASAVRLRISDGTVITGSVVSASSARFEITSLVSAAFAVNNNTYDFEAVLASGNLATPVVASPFIVNSNN